MTDEPRDHVIREALPWRDEQLTECGRPIVDVASAITVEQLRKRVKQYGQQRTAFTVCMTCYNHLHESWETNPAAVIRMEAHRSGQPLRSDRLHSAYAPITSTPIDHQLVHELHAAAKLIAAHRDEFDQHVAEAKAGEEWRLRLARRKAR